MTPVSNDEDLPPVAPRPDYESWASRARQPNDAAAFRRWRKRSIIIAGLAVMFVLLVLVASTGGHKKPSVPPTAVAQAHTSSARPALSWSGHLNRAFGTITIPRDSVIKWTAGGGFFAVMHKTGGPPGCGSEVVDHYESWLISGDRRGQSPISRGTYQCFTVQSGGDWTLRIVPDGQRSHRG